MSVSVRERENVCLYPRAFIYHSVCVCLIGEFV